MVREKELFLNSGSWEYDVSTGNMEWSEGMFHLYGYDKAEEIGEMKVDRGFMNSHQQAEEAIKSNEAWEKALARAPVGDSALENPVSGSSPAVFNIRKVVVESESPQSSKAYLITMRVKGAASVTQAKLQQVSELLPTLSLHSSFFAYDSEAERAENVSTLEQIIEKLEGLFNDGVSAAAAS